MGMTLDAGQLQGLDFWQSQVLCIAVYQLVILMLCLWFVSFSVAFTGLKALSVFGLQDDLLIKISFCVQTVCLASDFHKSGRLIDIVDQLTCDLTPPALHALP